MRRPLLAIAVAGLLHSGIASAEGAGTVVQDVRVHEDQLGTLIGEICSGIAARVQSLTAEDRAVDSKLCSRLPRGPLPPGIPRSYYVTVLGSDPCGQVAELEKELSAIDAARGAKIADLCGEARAFGETFPGLSGLGLNVVNGFSDFLRERAKDELVIYAVDRFGRQLCGAGPVQTCPAKDPGDAACMSSFALSSNATKAPTWSPSRQTPSFSELFPKGCCSVFPQGTGQDLDLDAITSGAATVALRDDIRFIPARVVPHVSFAIDDPTMKKAWTETLEALTVEAADLPHGAGPLEYFKRVAERLDRARTDPAHCMPEKMCDLTTPSGATLPCVALLFVEVGRESAAQFEHSASVDLGKWLEAALDTYCANYGSTSGDARCVISGDYPQAWHEHLRKFAGAIKKLAEVQAAIDATRKNGAFPTEIAKRSLPDVGVAMAAAGDVIADVLQTKANDAKAVAFVRAASRCIAALMAGDVPSLQQALVALTGAELVTALSPEQQQTLKFVAALASAKDRDAVKTVITDASAPLRSYRAKFTRRTGALWTVNAYVGIFGGVQWNKNLAASAGSGERETASALTAPVGIDVTLGHTKSYRHHFGLMLSAIDPFALTTRTGNDGNVKASWQSILAPGLLGRWGMARSPLSLLVGGFYRPGLQSSNSCGADPCWHGAVQAGVALTVDLPLLVVH